MNTSSVVCAALRDLDLPILRARVRLRLLADTFLPAVKGALLRGGFGYSFQQASCARPCWGASQTCTGGICPYRWVFETPHPPGIPQLHDLQDVPRPFVIQPPTDSRTRYRAGETLEFGLVVLGRGIDYLPYFLFSFERLGKLGLGKQRTPARLERVEALLPWQPVGRVLYQDGQVCAAAQEPPLVRLPDVAARAQLLPADLRLILETPLRIKARGALLETIEPAALVQAACWRLNALTTFHGGGPWAAPYRPLVTRAEAIGVERGQVHWAEWARTSTRGPEPRTMQLGGLVGQVLPAGSLTHIGKACVFGHSAYRLEPYHPALTEVGERVSG